MKTNVLLFALCTAILALLLTACASSSPTSQPPMPAIPPESHVPVILGVEERQGQEAGIPLIYENIHFSDNAGDAITVINRLISTEHPVGVSDENIRASSDEQKRGASHRSGWNCSTQNVFVIEYRILDKAGNSSKPVIVTVSCSSEMALEDAGSSLTDVSPAPFLSIGLVAVVGLISGLGLVLQRRSLNHGQSQGLEGKLASESLSSVIISAVRSILLLTFSFTLRSLLGSFLHEGGHALWNLIHGTTVTRFVVHPFSFSGYVRPLGEYSLWANLFPTILDVSVSLLIFVLLWKYRSVSNLPILMLFPFGAINYSIVILDSLVSATGDFYHVMQITGLPPVVFFATSLLLAGLGIFFFISLFPLLGLAPEDRKTLFVLPAGLCLWGMLGVSVAYLFVPVSRVVQDDSMAYDILRSVNAFPLLVMFLGLILAAIYVTFYRRLYRRFPAGLRTDTVSLTWRDLKNPGLLFAISVILGLIAIY
jgi:hypothetical protein